MPITLSTRDAGFEAGFVALLAGKRESAADVDATVMAIIEAVANRGDAALIEYTNRFDRIELTLETLRLRPGEIAAGADAAPAETVDALRFAAERIESFHRRQLSAPIDTSMPPGCGSGCAGGLSPRLASMCPAAPLPIRHPC
jgi:histidinol dehydrogenase